MFGLYFVSKRTLCKSEVHVIVGRVSAIGDVGRILSLNEIYAVRLQVLDNHVLFRKVDAASDGDCHYEQSRYQLEYLQPPVLVFDCSVNLTHGHVVHCPLGGLLINTLYAVLHLLPSFLSFFLINLFICL